MGSGNAGTGSTTYAIGCLSDSDCGEQQACAKSEGALPGDPGTCTFVAAEPWAASADDDADDAAPAAPPGAWQCAQVSDLGASAPYDAVILVALLALLALRRARRSSARH